MLSQNLALQDQVDELGLQLRLQEQHINRGGHQEHLVCNCLTNIISYSNYVHPNTMTIEALNRIFSKDKTIIIVFIANNDLFHCGINLFIIYCQKPFYSQSSGTSSRRQSRLQISIPHKLY